MHLVDPILVSKVCDREGRQVGKRGVDETLTEEEASSQKARKSLEAFIRIVLKYYGFDSTTTVKRWLAKGRLLNDNPNVRIQCDGSAALAFYLLYTCTHFRQHLGIVEQGSGGHWFVVGSVTTAPGPASPSFAKFVVNIWGANSAGYGLRALRRPDRQGCGGSNTFKLVFYLESEGRGPGPGRALRSVAGGLRWRRNCKHTYSAVRSLRNRESDMSVSRPGGGEQAPGLGSHWVSGVSGMSWRRAGARPTVLTARRVVSMTPPSRRDSFQDSTLAFMKFQIGGILKIGESVSANLAPQQRARNACMRA